MGKIVVDERRVLVPHPSEFLLNKFEILVRHVIVFDQASPCTFDTTQKFVELQRNNSCLSILSVWIRKTIKKVTMVPL